MVEVRRGYDLDKIKKDIKKMGRKKVIELRDYCNETLETVWGYEL